MEGTPVGRVGREFDWKGRQLEGLDPYVVDGSELEGFDSEDVVACSDRCWCC